MKSLLERWYALYPDFFSTRPPSASISINVNAFAPQFFLCNLNLSHQFLMCLRYIIECEYTPAQLEKKVGAKGHEGPEGKLVSSRQ